jgi:hypothetical protein
MNPGNALHPPQDPVCCRRQQGIWRRAAPVARRRAGICQPAKSNRRPSTLRAPRVVDLRDGGLRQVLPSLTRTAWSGAYVDSRLTTSGQCPQRNSTGFQFSLALVRGIPTVSINSHQNSHQTILASPILRGQFSLNLLFCWCREGGSNPHGRKGRRILSPLRLPVPPSRLYVEVTDFKVYFV